MATDDAGSDLTLRAGLVAAGRRLGARGLISAAEGNLSVRLPGDRLLITPTGLRKDELEPDDLLVVPLDPDGTSPTDAGPRPSSDVAIHRAIYRARADVLAVVHAHLPASMALSLAGEVPDPAVLPETAFLLPRIPYVPFGAMGSDELAGRIAAALVTPDEPMPGAAILERHGAVAVGSGEPATPGSRGPVPADAAGPPAASITASLASAVNRLELVDVLCRAWRDALLIRAATGRATHLEPPA